MVALQSLEYGNSPGYKKCSQYDYWHYKKNKNRFVLVYLLCKKRRSSSSEHTFYKYVLSHLSPYIILLDEISGSHGGEYEDGCLQGCSAV
jgi:hypothetical protein